MEGARPQQMTEEARGGEETLVAKKFRGTQPGPEESSEGCCVLPRGSSPSGVARARYREGIPKRGQAEGSGPKVGLGKSPLPVPLRLFLQDPPGHCIHCVHAQEARSAGVTANGQSWQSFLIILALHLSSPSPVPTKCACVRACAGKGCAGDIARGLLRGNGGRCVLSCP